MKRKISILFVDDDRHVLASTAEWLRTLGHTIFEADGLASAVRQLEANHPDLAFVDLQLGADSGFELLRRIRSEYPRTAAVMLSGHGTVELAVQALHLGALDFLVKPLLDDKMLRIIDRFATGQTTQVHMARVSVPGSTSASGSTPAPGGFFQGIVGSDPRMLQVFEIIERIADTRATVLLTGESGTGKSMIARAIHQKSPRSAGPFVEVACGALTESLLESELFGHAAGAFTGAVGEKVGKFLQADRGTVFLDEIGTATPAMQIKLLRVLQDFEFEPVGSTRTYHVDTRVVLATNENLAEAVAQRRFREDLFYRINVIHIEIPALRFRTGDIAPLAEFFREKACRESNRHVAGFSHEALALMKMYPWPGNVRELQNVVERLVLLGRNRVVTPADLPGNILNQNGVPRRFLDAHAPQPGRGSGRAVDRPLRESLSVPEREIILESLVANHWCRAKTASALGIDRTTLYKKMKKFQLSNQESENFSNYTDSQG